MQRPARLSAPVQLAMRLSGVHLMLAQSFDGPTDTLGGWVPVSGGGAENSGRALPVAERRAYGYGRLRLLQDHAFALPTRTKTIEILHAWYGAPKKPKKQTGGERPASDQDAVQMVGGVSSWDMEDEDRMDQTLVLQSLVDQAAEAGEDLIFPPTAPQQVMGTTANGAMGASGSSSLLPAQHLTYNQVFGDLHSSQGGVDWSSGQSRRDVGGRKLNSSKLLDRRVSSKLSKPLLRATQKKVLHVEYRLRGAQPICDVIGVGASFEFVLGRHVQSPSDVRRPWQRQQQQIQRQRLQQPKSQPKASSSATPLTTADGAAAAQAVGALPAATGTSGDSHRKSLTEKLTFNLGFDNLNLGLESLNLKPLVGNIGDVGDKLVDNLKAGAGDVGDKLLDLLDEGERGEAELEEDDDESEEDGGDSGVEQEGADSVATGTLSERRQNVDGSFSSNAPSYGHYPRAASGAQGDSSHAGPVVHSDDARSHLQLAMSVGVSKLFVLDPHQKAAFITVIQPFDEADSGNSAAGGGQQGARPGPPNTGAGSILSYY